MVPTIPRERVRRIILDEFCSDFEDSKLSHPTELFKTPYPNNLNKRRRKTTNRWPYTTRGKGPNKKLNIGKKTFIVVQYFMYSNHKNWSKRGNKTEKKEEEEEATNVRSNKISADMCKFVFFKEKERKWVILLQEHLYSCVSTMLVSNHRKMEGN